MRTGMIGVLALGLVTGMAAARPDDTDPASKHPDQWFSVVENEKVEVPKIEMGDRATILKIIEEGKKNNKVMEHLTVLSERFGPRLTGSTRLENGQRWATEQFKSWGLTAEMVQWGTIGVRFDRGPSSARVLLGTPRRTESGEEMDWTVAREMQFSTMSWTPGTSGPKAGMVIREPATDEEYEKVKDKLAASWILLRPTPVVGQRGVRNVTGDRYRQRAELRKKMKEGTVDAATLSIRDRLVLAGAHGFLTVSRDLRDRVWTGAVGGWRDLTMETLHQDVEVILRQSDYDFINSRLADGEQVRAEINLDHKFSGGPDGGKVPVYNVVAELRGTEKPEECVIVCGHMDSWDGPGSLGTTDNGTGSSVTIEAARILTAIGAKPKRSIRFILWTGEEQGLLGARSYVEQIKPEWDKVSAVLNDDGGTNYQGGIPAADVMVDYLAAATAPTNWAFPTMTVNVRKTGDRIRTHGSSDHAAFNAVGIPGFFWDEVGRADYGYGWHTQHDRVDLAVKEYLVQSSTNAAIAAYNLACAPELLPRAKPAENSERVRPREGSPGGPARQN